MTMLSRTTLRCGDSPMSDALSDNQTGPTLRGSRCEVISLDARPNKRGDYEIKPSTAPLEVDRQSTGRSQYAVTFFRYFDQKGRMVQSKLKINSPHILKTLKSLVTFYPGAPIITDKKVNYDSPYHLLVHYLEDFRTYRANSEDDVVKMHINLLIQVIEVEKSEELGELKTLLSEKKITFPLVWALFRPGNMVLTSINGPMEKYRTYSTEYIQRRGLLFKGEQIDYDGTEFMVRNRSFIIRPFAGVIDISSLQICPLEFHPKGETLNQSITDRGHRWFSIQRVSPKMMACDGVCIAAGGDEDRLKTLTTFGRIVIDNRMYGVINGRSKKPETMYQAVIELIRKVTEEVDEGEDGSKSNPTSGDSASIQSNSQLTDEAGDGRKSNPTSGELVSVQSNDQLTDEDAALCTAFVRGYSLNKRVWGAFDVDTVKEIEWWHNAFERLILRKASKDAILALVQAYVGTPTADITQDLVQGKGLGMIFLLHGPPGVGKTLTAETIAEHLKRPLYVIGGGELGTTPSEVEVRLSRVLEVATVWKAVVLIDEADVFLQQRDLNNLERNSLVAIFLRQLEYFEGLMFLTTNRANCIDEAFRSRIDVALHYPELSETMRSKLWESSLKSLDPDTLDMDLATVIPELAKEEMNGREIRKIIKAARLMATYYEKKLSVDHLRALMGFRMIGSLPEMVEDVGKKPNSGTKRLRED